MRANRQRHTDTLITILRSSYRPYWGDVKKSCAYVTDQCLTASFSFGSFIRIYAFYVHVDLFEDNLVDE